MTQIRINWQRGTVPFVDDTAQGRKASILRLPQNTRCYVSDASCSLSRALPLHRLARVAQDGHNAPFFTPCTARDQSSVITTSLSRMFRGSLDVLPVRARIINNMVCFSFLVKILIEPSENLIMPLQAEKDTLLRTESAQIYVTTHLFRWFRTQWFSSGKITRRLGIPRLRHQLASATQPRTSRRNTYC